VSFQSPFATTPPPPAVPRPRVIPGANIRATREWLAPRVEQLDDWSCPERVLVVVGALLAGVGSTTGSDLTAAIGEPDTVDLALLLLLEVGLACDA
jgi:hypothetical protein